MKKHFFLPLILVTVLVTTTFCLALAGDETSSASVAQQDQAQLQGQNQGQSMGGQSNNQNLSVVFGASTPKRSGFAPGANIPGAGMVSDIAGPSEHYGPHYMHMMDILKYSVSSGEGVAVFDREDVASIYEANQHLFASEPYVHLMPFGFAKKLKAVNQVMVVFSPLVAKTAKGEDGGKPITWTYLGPSSLIDDVKKAGMFTVEATDNNQTSFDIFCCLLVDAMDKGISVVEVSRQDVVRILWSKGHGIGTYATGATLNDGVANATSGTAGGGTGYAWSSSGFDQMPFMTGQLLVAVPAAP